jgi:hypothetical protein
MKKVSFWSLVPMILLVSVVSARAQIDSRVQSRATEQPQKKTKPVSKPGPFSAQWAKPPATTGGQIYNDPRTRNPDRSYSRQRNKPCPAPTISDPASGGCR